MKAKEIYSMLIKGIPQNAGTCDGILMGDGEREVRRIATCHKLTFDVLSAASATGTDMILTHEPPFANGNSPAEDLTPDAEKARRIAESGIAVYRFHDNAHNFKPDLIHHGFIRATGLQIKQCTERISLGVCRYLLEEPVCVDDIAEKCRCSLGASHPRLVGVAGMKTDSVILALGGIGIAQIDLLRKPGNDFIITGEVNEVCYLEYVRDICRLYGEKAVLLLGHYTAEYRGMHSLADILRENGFDAFAIDSGEVWDHNCSD